MGFKYWYEGFMFISIFTFIISLPCAFVLIWGTKMINELGNFPTKAAQIQTTTLWKLFIVEIVSSLLLLVFYKIFVST